MLTNAQIALIKDNQSVAIEIKSLSDEQLKLIYENNWFNLWVPPSLHGLGCSLVEGCQFLEEIAYYDGGLGWTLTLCAGANMFAGFLDPALAESVFSNPKVCFGGSGQIGGRADRVAGGYKLSGSWKYATGAPHLTHFTANAYLYQAGKALVDSDGNPQYVSFFIDRDDVLVHGDWDSFGLEATASHSFSVSELFVAENRAFELLPEKRKLDAFIYHYPFISFAEATLCVNYIGMFKRFLAVVEKEFLGRSVDKNWHVSYGKAYLQEIDAARTALLQERAEFYTEITRTWTSITQNESGLSTDYTDLAALCRRLVDHIKKSTISLYLHTGIKGAQRDQEINILFRNLFTASQHSLLNR